VGGGGGNEQRCFSCRASSLVTTNSAMPAAFCNKGLREIRPFSLVSCFMLRDVEFSVIFRCVSILGRVHEIAKGDC